MKDHPIEHSTALIEVGAGFEFLQTPHYQGKVSNLYRKLARVYDLFTDHELAHHKKAIQMAEIQDDELVLEVACGTGRATVEIAKHLGKKGKLYAIDLTEEMVAQAKNKLKKSALLDQVDVRVGNANHLPYPDGKFDFIYNSYMFDLLDILEMPRILSEFKRVLKPGGKLVLVNMSKKKKGKTFYEFLYEKRLLGEASGACRPVFMKSLVEQAGFEKVERIYRKNESFFFLNWLHGTEIVTAQKPS